MEVLRLLRVCRWFGRFGPWVRAGARTAAGQCTDARRQRVEPVTRDAGISLHPVAGAWSTSAGASRSRARHPRGRPTRAAAARSPRERMNARANERSHRAQPEWLSFSFTSPCCSPLISARTPSLRSAPSPLPSTRGWRHICTPLNVSLHCHDPSLRACAVSCCWSHRT